jgi:nucleoside-diphosphate-sugar epimerase
VLARHGRVRAANRRGTADLPPEVEVVRADATDPDSTREICRGASVVYHCAGAPYAEWPAMLPRLMDGIIEGAAAVGARLVYGDNLHAYGPVNGPMFESHPDRPAGPKGETRARVARQLLDAHRDGYVRATIGRSPDFYGPGVRLAALGEQVFRAALANKPARVLGDVDAAHSYSYIDDFAASLVQLSEYPEAFGEVWHTPNDEPLTTREMLTLIYCEADAELRFRSNSRLALAVAGWFSPVMREVQETLYQYDRPFVADHSKFARALGARPTRHREAIRATLDWWARQA